VQAAAILGGFSIDLTAFVWVVILFTVIEVVLDPLMTKIALQYAPVLRGGVALVTTFVGLLVATIVSNGITINGATAWVVGTLIVWLGAVLAAIVLPLFLFRKALGRDWRGQA